MVYCIVCATHFISVIEHVRLYMECTCFGQIYLHHLNSVFILQSVLSNINYVILFLWFVVVSYIFIHPFSPPLPCTRGYFLQLHIWHPARVARTVGSWSDISSSPHDLSMWLAWIFSQCGNLGIVSLFHIWLLSVPRVEIKMLRWNLHIFLGLSLWSPRISFLLHCQSSQSLWPVEMQGEGNQTPFLHKEHLCKGRKRISGSYVQMLLTTPKLRASDTLLNSVQLCYFRALKIIDYFINILIVNYNTLHFYPPMAYFT